MSRAAGLAAAITPDLVRGGAGGDSKARLGTVQLACGDEGSPSFAAVFLLRCRSEGFLALMPVAEEVQAVLEAHPHQGSDSVLLDRIEVMMETPRGRALEVQEVFIVDLPWYYLTLFRKCPSRAAGGRQILFHSGATICRPVLTGALETTQQWIADTLDGETAQEYTDAREEESDAVEAEPSTPIAASQQGAGEIQSL